MKLLSRVYGIAYDNIKAFFGFYYFFLCEKKIFFDDVETFMVRKFLKRNYANFIILYSCRQN